MRIRKHHGRLTPAERHAFVQALLALKDDGRYDEHVRSYQRAAGWARRGPAFLPWQRHMLLRFEEDLRSVDPDVTVPYWDFVHERSTQASLWNDDFMGGDGRPHDGMVITGPFATEAGAWPLVHGGFLIRRLGRDPVATSLPTVEDLQHALDDAVYDEDPWSASSASGFRNRVEGWVRGPALHNRVHAWVGGVMARADAPDDPLFWLVAAFVDRLWGDWQSRHPGAEYRPQRGGPRGHNLDDTLWPWDGGDVPERVEPFGESPVVVRPRDLLDHRALGYVYDTDPEVGAGRVTTQAVGEEQPTFGFGEDVPAPPLDAMGPRVGPSDDAAPEADDAETATVGSPRPTTMMVGEEDPRPTTMTAGEEDPRPTTMTAGEEGPRPTTMMVGEEDRPAAPNPYRGPPPQASMTTLALGEEGPQLTTLAVGEEGPQLTTLAIGEEGPQLTTLAIGEEGPPMTTLAMGEENPPVTTLAQGEEQAPGTTETAGGAGPRMTTLAVGEESAPSTTQVTGEGSGDAEPDGGGDGPFGRY